MGDFVSGQKGVRAPRAAHSRVLARPILLTIQIAKWRVRSQTTPSAQSPKWFHFVKIKVGQLSRNRIPKKNVQLQQKRVKFAGVCLCWR